MSFFWESTSRFWKIFYGVFRVFIRIISHWQSTSWTWAENCIQIFPLYYIAKSQISLVGEMIYKESHRNVCIIFLLIDWKLNAYPFNSFPHQKSNDLTFPKHVPLKGNIPSNYFWNHWRYSILEPTIEFTVKSVSNQF